MAEFMDKPEQHSARASDALTEDGMNSFGKPVPLYRRAAAFEHCRSMGLKSSNKIMGMVNRMSGAIERDQPYEAMTHGMAYLDLIGTYRLLAVLCVAQKPRISVRAAT